MAKTNIALSEEMKDFLRLLYAGCHNISDKQEEFEKYPLDAIYELSLRTGFTAFIDCVLEINHTRHGSFMTAKDIVTAIYLMRHKAVEELTNYLEEEKIRYLLFKGWVMKDYYIDPIYREMGDVDIYVDPKDFEKAENYLKNTQFEKDDCETTYETSYWRGEIEIEIHHSLLNGGLNSYWNTFQKECLDRSVLLDGKQYGYTLNPDDHYIFMVEHAYKHHVEQGMGIRFLLDLWVYRHYFEEKLNEEYIDETLKKLEIKEYEGHAREVAELLFTDGIDNIELTAELEKEIALYILNGAAQGAFRDGQIIEDINEVKGKSWWYIYRYTLKALEEKPEWYAFHSPFAYKHKWYRPIYMFGLSAKTVLNNPNETANKYGG